MTIRPIAAIAWLLAIALVTAGAWSLADPPPAPDGASDPSDTGGGDRADAATTQPDGPESLARFYGFGPMEILKLEWGIGRPIIVDINGDGLNDLVLTNNRKARIELLLQKRGGPTTQPEALPEDEDVDINDVTGKERQWRFRRVSFPLDVEAGSLVVGDFNNDGLPDLAYCAKGRGLFIVLQERADQEQGPADAAAAAPAEPKWKPPHRIEITDAQATWRSLAAGDFNGDGRTDLAVLGGDGVYVLLQNEDGTMARPVKHPSSGQVLLGQYAADLNGDGRDDLVVLTGDRELPVSVRFQTAAGQLGPEVRYELPVPSVFVPSRLDDSPRSYVLSVARQSGRLRLSALVASGQKSDYPVYSYPLPGGGEGAENRDALAVDVNGDGLLDVVVSDPAQAEFLLFLASPDAPLGTPKRFPGLMDMRKLSALPPGERGGNGVVALSVREKIIGVSRFEKGRLTFPESVTIEGEPLAMDVADIDGDGKADLVYLAQGAEDKKFYLRTVLGVGLDGARAGPSVELTELKDKPLDLRVGDIDGDGRPDAMVLRPYEPLLLVRRDAEGHFVPEARRDVQSGLVANVFAAMMSLAPLGPGGGEAVLLAQRNFARALVFDPDKGWQVVDQYETADPRSSLAAAAAFRMPPDARSPSVVTYDSARGKLGILAQQDDGTYRTTGEIDVGQVSARTILSGNFGGGSTVSLLLCAVQKLVLVPVAGETDVLRELASFEPDIEGARYGELTVGDVNGDGLVDILLAEQARNHVQILTFDAEGDLVSASKFKVFEQARDASRRDYLGRREEEGGEPQALAVGDVTGDGKADLVMLIHDRIIIYPQD